MKNCFLCGRHDCSVQIFDLIPIQHIWDVVSGAFETGLCLCHLTWFVHILTNKFQ